MRPSLRLALLASTGCGAGACGAPPNLDVTVFDARGPAAGVRVAFDDAAGSLTDEATTDASGHAAGAITAGGSVTVLRGGGQQTLFGVQPGDELGFDARAPIGGPTPAPLAVDFAPSAGATGYRVLAPCAVGSGAAPPLTLDVSSGCPARGPLLLLARGADGPTAYAYLADAPLTAGSYTAAAAWTPVEHVAVSVTGLTSSDVVSVDTLAALGNATYDEYAPITYPTSTWSLATVPSLPDGLRVWSAEGTRNRAQTVYLPLAPGATTATIDLATDPLPTIDSAHYDVASHAVLVAVDPPPGDVIDADVQYTIDGTGWDWQLFGATPVFHLPELPSGFAPAPTVDVPEVSAAQIVIDGQSYDQLRARAVNLRALFQLRLAGPPATRVRIES